MDLLLFVLLLVVLAVAAELWGIDTRDFDPAGRAYGVERPLTLF